MPAVTNTTTINLLRISDVHRVMSYKGQRWDKARRILDHEGPRPCHPARFTRRPAASRRFVDQHLSPRDYVGSSRLCTYSVCRSTCVAVLAALCATIFTMSRGLPRNPSLLLNTCSDAFNISAVAFAIFAKKCCSLASKVSSSG